MAGSDAAQRIHKTHWGLSLHADLPSIQLRMWSCNSDMYHIAVDA